MKHEPNDVKPGHEPLYSGDDNVTIPGAQIVAEKTVYLHCRMKPDHMAKLDELVGYHDRADRTEMIRELIKEAHTKMIREKAKKAKENTE